MYTEEFKNYFTREINKDKVIEKINISKITLIEAKIIWERLNEDIECGFRKLIVDVSACSIIDPTFIQIILEIKTKIALQNGNLKIILPNTNLEMFNKINHLVTPAEA